jgi:hypothetical protein
MKRGLSIVTAVLVVAGCGAGVEPASKSKQGICYIDQGCDPEPGPTCSPPIGFGYSTFTGPNCTGDEYAYQSSSGYITTWDGQGCVWPFWTEFTMYSYKWWGGGCDNLEGHAFGGYPVSR